MDHFTFGIPSILNSDEGTLEEPIKTLESPMFGLKIPSKRKSTNLINPLQRNTLRRVSLQGNHQDKKIVEKSLFNRQQHEKLSTNKGIQSISV